MSQDIFIEIILSISYALLMKRSLYFSYAVAVLGIAFVYTFFILLENRLLPGIALTGDTMVFATFGLGWVHDLIPYRDLFDHKGPAIFFVNALAYTLGQGYMGIMLVEIAVATAWLALLLYLFREHPLYGMWSIISGLVIILGMAHNGGNFTEEYCLLFAVLSMVIFLTKKPSFFWQFFLYGLCGACTFLFRANNAIIPLLICCFAFLELRSWAAWKKAFMAAGLGFICIMLPTLGYFYGHDSLQSALDAALLYNLTYVDNSNTLQGALSLALRFSPAIIMECMLLGWLVYKQRDMRTLQCVILFFATLIIGCLLSGRKYNHYMITLLPVHFYLCHVAMPTLLSAAKIQWEKYKNSHALLQKMRTQKACCLMLLVAMLAMGTKVFFRFDDTPLQVERAALQDAGVSHSSAILNLNKVKGCRVFVVTESLPRQRIFFEPSGQGVNNQKFLWGRTAPEDYAQKYDFIVAEEAFTHEQFERVAHFHWGTLFKKK